MQAILSEITKYLVPLAVAALGFLFARLRYLSGEVANLKSVALKVQQDKELAPLDQQIKEAEANVKADRDALDSSISVHTSTTPS